MKYLRNCLESLYLAECKEIIVVDNGSTDGSKEFLINENKIKKVFLAENVGLARASNIGAKNSTGDYLCFLNNDTMVDPFIFKHLLNDIKDNAVMGARMFNYDGTKELDSAISLDRFGCPAGKTGPMFYPDGLIFIKRNVFEQIGGFDEKLFLYGEDRDLCWRVHLIGYGVTYSSNSHFCHNSRSVCGTNYFQRKISERNVIRSMLKNYSIGYLFRRLPQYVFWSILEIGYMLFCNPKAILHCYIPAYWWNIVNFKDTMKERKRVQKSRIIKDKDLPFSKVIGKLWVLKNMGVPKWN
jgi:GT2 family glycosyltransferase